MALEFIGTEWPLPNIARDLILEFDLFAIKPIDGDLHRGWHEWNKAPELFYTPKNGGYWVATSAEAIAEIFRDNDRFSASGISLIREHGGANFIPGELDPPLHTAFRKVLNPETSPRRIKAFEESSRQLCIHLIENVLPDGGCEFHAAVAEKMPILNFLHFMNLPLSDAEILLPAANTITRNPDMSAFGAAIGELHEYIDQRIDERIDAPLDDFISRLIVAEIEERAITHDEARVTVLNIMLGGLDTATASMGFFFNFLARNPGHRRQLADEPSLIPEAIEELLRRHGIFSTGRAVKADCEFRGMHLRKNDLILLPGALHNLDERLFPDPLEVRFDRPNRGLHATFGFGIHRCLGSNIARAQLRILLEEWLKRIPEFSIAADQEAEFRSGRANMVTRLPLVW
jgi:cytochrome P450